MMRILRLTIYWKYLRLIRHGLKTIEYREIKPYWISRLRGKTYDEVLFKNGYKKHSPTVRCKFIRTFENINTGKFEIYLGEIIRD